MSSEFSLRRNRPIVTNAFERNGIGSISEKATLDLVVAAMLLSENKRVCFSEAVDFLLNPTQRNISFQREDIEPNRDAINRAAVVLGYGRNELKGMPTSRPVSLLEMALEARNRGATLFDWPDYQNGDSSL